MQKLISCSYCIVIVVNVWHCNTEKNISEYSYYYIWLGVDLIWSVFRLKGIGGISEKIINYKYVCIHIWISIEREKIMQKLTWKTEGANTRSYDYFMESLQELLKNFIVKMYYFVIFLLTTLSLKITILLIFCLRKMTLSHL